MHYLARAFPLDWIDLLFMETSLLQEARSFTFSAMDAIIFIRYGGMISYRAVFIFDIGTYFLCHAYLTCLNSQLCDMVTCPLIAYRGGSVFWTLDLTGWLVQFVAEDASLLIQVRLQRHPCVWSLFSKQKFFIRSNSILWPNLSNLTPTGHFLYYGTWHKYNNEVVYILPSN